MINESEKRLHRVCFTGHRPEKLSQPEEVIIEKLEIAIRQAVADGMNVFISGMARGVDIWAAEIVLKLKREGLDVKLICAVPYCGFESMWGHGWQQRYQAILNNADFVQYIYPNYKRSCFQDRNEWMVNHASRVIAVYNGQPSGTRNTIEYAKKKRVPVVLCN